MLDTLRFRIYDVDEGKMIYGSPIDIINLHENKYTNTEIMRYTGREDVFGKPLYEDDVFLFINNPDKVKSVVFKYGSWCYKEEFKTIEPFGWYHDIFDGIMPDKKWKEHPILIIGHLYDSPEELKKRSAQAIKDIKNGKYDTIIHDSAKIDKFFEGEE